MNKVLITGNLTQAIVTILPQMNEVNKGIYHYTNEGVCSWHDFATEVMAMSRLKCKVNAIHSSAYPTKVKHPHYSVLCKQKIKKTFGIEIQHWKKGVKQCLKQF